MVYYLPLLLEARFSWKNKRNCDERCPSILSGNVRSRESWWTNTLYIGIWPSWNDLSRRWFRFKSAFELKSKSILQIQCWTNTCKWMSVGALEVDISLWDVTLTFTTPSPCSLPVPPLRPMLLRFSFFFFTFLLSDCWKKNSETWKIWNFRSNLNVQNVLPTRMDAWSNDDRMAGPKWNSAQLIGKSQKGPLSTWKRSQSSSNQVQP